MSLFLELLMVSLLVATTSSLVGNFLILRGGALTAFALSHSILFGIVVVFLITKDLNSPFLLIGAALAGLLIVTLVEILTKSRYVKQDAALGVVYLFIFALGLLLLSKFAADTTLSTKSVVTGNIALVPFDRLIIGNTDLGPKLIWMTSIVLLLNIIYITLFYKELKITAIDHEFARILGFNPSIINLSFMFMVSITIVNNFKVAGIIVVVGLMIIPPATAFLLTKRVSKMIYLSILISVASAIIGFLISWELGGVEISSVITIISGIMFIIAMLFAPRRGIITEFVIKKKPLEES